MQLFLASHHTSEESDLSARRNASGLVLMEPFQPRSHLQPIEDGNEVKPSHSVGDLDHDVDYDAD